jgi:hypothetical protein
VKTPGELNEQVVNCKRPWFPASESVTVLARPNRLGLPGERGIKCGVANRGSGSSVCLAVRVREVAHFAGRSLRQLIATARNGIVESSIVEVRQSVVIQCVEADRHACSDQGGHRVGFKNSG